MIGKSDDETNFPHELLLSNRQVASLRKDFANNSLTDIKLSKIQLSKVIQSGGFLGRFLGLLLKTTLSLIKKLIKPLGKNLLITLGLTNFKIFIRMNPDLIEFILEIIYLQK